VGHRVKEIEHDVDDIFDICYMHAELGFPRAMIAQYGANVVTGSIAAVRRRSDRSLERCEERCEIETSHRDHMRRVH